MRLAQIVAIHPLRRTVDIVYCDTGLPVGEVHIVGSLVGNDVGEWDIPTVPKPSSGAKAGAPPETGRQLMGIVDVIEGHPAVTGFIHPLGGQMAFTQDNRQVYKHASGVYTTIAPDGSIETWHPSGAYVRIGTGAHEKLASISANQNWEEKSDQPAPTITVHAAKFDLSIDPSGNITLHGQGTATLTVDKAVQVNAGSTLAFSSQGNTSFNVASGSFTVTAPTINLN